MYRCKWHWQILFTYYKGKTLDQNWNFTVVQQLAIKFMFECIYVYLSKLFCNDTISESGRNCRFLLSNAYLEHVFSYHLRCTDFYLSILYVHGLFVTTQTVLSRLCYHPRYVTLRRCIWLGIYLNPSRAVCACVRVCIVTQVPTWTTINDFVCV